MKIFTTLILVFVSFYFVSTAQANLIAPESVCPNQTKTTTTSKQKLDAMFCMANYARVKSGARKLKRNSKLDWSAKEKSDEILRCQQFSHTACGRKFEYWILRAKYPKRCYSIAENIAWGSSYLGNVRNIFIAWMKSPPHRKALLNKSYKDSGIGITKGKLLGYSGAAVWTQHFGKNC